jgi:hypothetical protein
MTIRYKVIEKCMPGMSGEAEKKYYSVTTGELTLEGSSSCAVF